MLNLKSYLRFLSRNKLYTFVNVFGLSVSLMFVILIANYTLSEFTADSFQENADQIYVLANEEFAGTAYKIGEKLLNRYPEIEKVCGVIPASSDSPVEILGNKIRARVIAVDSTFFSMFSFRLLEGDRNQVLKSQNDVLVSESFARKMFGSKNPVGQMITVHDSLVYTINGIVEDFKNSLFKPVDIIIPVENMEYFNSGTISEGMYNAASTILFVQTAKGSNINAKEAEIAEYFKTFFWIYQQEAVKKVLFTPMRDLYFHENSPWMWSWNSNDKMILTVLVFVGMLILLFAVINYINLTVAQTGFRAKEVATRRLYGASKIKASVRMIFESLLLCFVAFVIGYFLSFALEPYASSLIGKDIMLLENLSIGSGILSILFVVFLGAVSGIIPAVVISRFQPIDVVKGTYTFKSKMTFSKIFISLQSAITIILLACSLTIYRQVEYLINYDYGYNHTAILDVGYTPDAEILRDKLKALSSVKSVGFTRGTPFDRGNNGTMKIEGTGKSISFQMLISDLATIKMLGIEFIKDNRLAERGYWINQTALDELGATDELKSFRSGREYKIAGVIKEFAIGDLVSTRNSGGKSPMLLEIDDDLKHPWSVLVEIQGDLVDGYLDVKHTFEEVSDGVEFTGEYIDDQIEKSYAMQRRIQMIMLVFAIIAIIISSLGLLAISSYFIQQRSREIAVRKVFGSTHFEVLMLVIWKFIRLVLVAFVIACPIIWYAMNEWLKDFPQRTNLSVWIFIAAGVLTLLISFITVFWQSSIAANTSPVESMKR